MNGSEDVLLLAYVSKRCMRIQYHQCSGTKKGLGESKERLSLAQLYPNQNEYLSVDVQKGYKVVNNFVLEVSRCFSPKIKVHK